ncbi:hypothetical protein Kisp01_30980 [Kineosporia sp. NBRC 101677]|uniref:hypothetical protein n=1 Tax=Kineosporia sp. NBRC 101677 TaxID=3032197 RepID=UPI0024A5CE4D|nr:hypothetical protein [Kineosporia sp. NBRC 101677]GLY16083.1 hypothetical protein Kisp01_30980 [Kineosporia sp. NBRC 101677]
MMASLEDRVSAMERVLGMEDGKVGPEGHLGAVVRSHTQVLHDLKVNQAHHNVTLDQLRREQRRQSEALHLYGSVLTDMKSEQREMRADIHDLYVGQREMRAEMKGMRAEMKGLHEKQDKLLEMLTAFISQGRPLGGS